MKTSGEAIPLVAGKPAAREAALQIATKCQIKDTRLFLLAVGNRKRERMEMAPELLLNSLYIFQRRLSAPN